VQERGVIVVDSCALLDLQAAVRPEFLDDAGAAGHKPRHYLDLLTFLGRHGWHVLIPEMVALESAGVLADAPNIDDLFSASQHNRAMRLPNHALRRWLDQARDGRLPGVSLVPASPTTAVGDYVESVRRVAADPGYSTKRKCDVLALVQKKDRRHFGEEACLDEIALHLEAPGEPMPPVFFLSDDLGAQDEAHRRFGERVGRINVKGFMTALTSPGLAESLGVRAGRRADMYADLLEQAGFEPRAGLSLDLPRMDTSQPPRQGNDFCFNKAIESLAQTLGPAADFVETAPPSEPPPLSRAEQFRRKWNWRGPGV